MWDTKPSDRNSYPLNPLAFDSFCTGEWSTFVVSHISPKTSEMWGTQGLFAGTECNLQLVTTDGYCSIHQTANEIPAKLTTLLSSMFHCW